MSSPRCNSGLSAVARTGTGAAIELRILREGRGSAWTPADFLDLGNRSTVYRVLGELHRAGMLQRLDRGLYSYPELSPRLGVIAPLPEVVALAVARATGSRLQLAGAGAANAMGLSKQVPARSVYLTDGPSRTVRIGRQTVELRHTPPKELQGAGTLAGLALQALRYLGADSVDVAVVRKLGTKLGAVDKRLLRRFARELPIWMQSVVEEVVAFKRSAG